MGHGENIPQAMDYHVHWNLFDLQCTATVYANIDTAEPEPLVKALNQDRLHLSQPWRATPGKKGRCKSAPWKGHESARYGP